ncbi:hypothetical protein WJX74_004109 [Apatococcus lobatus]|uniref:Serine aminopeptidase S33 domain-containing protein n=1 Tax=Apatococcus lobatus TaxID=904363 RepID=A0AAW1R219_9CHLO
MLGSLHEVRPGRVLYVETSYGNPDGEFAGNSLVALLIHGAMCHHSQYAEQAKALIGSGVSVVVFDLLGCGDSTKPRPDDHAERMRVYGPQEIYQDCIAVMNQFTSEWDSVFVAGHSYGGPLTVRLAAEHPKRIAGILCLGFGYPTAPAPQETSWLRRSCRAAGWGKGKSGFGWWLKLPEWMLQLIMPYVASIIIHTVYHPNTFKRRPHMVSNEWWAWAGNAPWVVQALTPGIGKLVKDMEELKSLIRSISAPALIIDQESKAPPGKTGPELMAADMQDGEGHAIPMSFHQVHQDQPDAVNEYLLDFLRRKVCHVQV